ncbi:uncharacterized protein LOC135366858 [Ornithodoros turicata]|uniref:uncharacterized protein LOC135366858 n=1 Tax=Ornithodoros turicata TaxID=34597 RepID=UPI0031387E79
MEEPFEFHIRPVRPDEIPLLLDIRLSMGYLCAESLLETLLTLDPDGFLVAVKQSGEVCGGCAIVKLNKTLAYVGFWGIQHKYRDSPLAKELVTKTMRRVQDMNVMLRSSRGSVRDMQLGGLFPHVSDHLFHRVGPGLPQLTDLPVALDGTRVVNFDEGIHLDRVSWYTTDIMKTQMHDYFRCLSEEKGLIFKLAFEHDALCGMGTIQRDIGGAALVRHVFAQRPEVARLILRNLVESFPLATQVGVVMVCTTVHFKDQPLLYTNMDLEPKRNIAICFSKKEVPFDYSRIFVL